MISLNDFTDILADGFFNGDASIAGMVIFAAVMAVIFALFGRRGFLVPLALMLPITLVFTSLGVLPEALTIILVVVAVVGLAKEAKDRI
jgi:hypothetical protein